MPEGSILRNSNRMCLSSMLTEGTNDLNKCDLNTCKKSAEVNTGNIDCGWPILSFAEDSRQLYATTPGSSVLCIEQKFAP